MSTTQVEIQRFNGFKSSDGTIHDTHAKAVAHTVELKTVEALGAVAETIIGRNRKPSGEVNDELGFEEDYRGNAAIYTVEGLTALLAAHREELRAALNQKVVVRKPRTSKAGA